jgi:hypothetical protein
MVNATLDCAQCGRPVLARMTRCPRCGAAPEGAGAIARTETRVHARPLSVASSERGDLGRLVEVLPELLVRGGPMAALSACVTAPVAVAFACVVIVVVSQMGWLMALVGTAAAISLAIAATIAAPLASFLIASTGETPRANVVAQLALSRAPALAWFIVVLYFCQLGVAIPFWLVGAKGEHPGVAALLGSVAGFLLAARFGVLGMAYTVLENAPFGKTVERTVAVGRGRLPLLLVAAGIPRLAQTLACVAASSSLVRLDPIAGPAIVWSHAALLLAALLGAFLLEVALSAAALGIANGRTAPVVA